jgi:amino acid permease
MVSSKEESPKQPNKEESAAPSHQQSTWIQSLTVVVGMSLGTGIIGLPHAIGSLGWVVGIGATTTFCLFSCYSCLLLSRVRNQHCPEAKSLSDLARSLEGDNFGDATRFVIISNWLFLLPYYLMAAASALALACCLVKV